MGRRSVSAFELRHSRSLAARAGLSRPSQSKRVRVTSIGNSRISSGDGGAAQNAKSLVKFRERIVELEAQRNDIEQAIDELRKGCDALEQRLAATRPDLLPRAADYDQVLRERLGDLEHAK